MILRTGVDLIEIERMRQAIERHGERFLNRVFTPGELAHCAGRVESLAARFAAKEALYKALSPEHGLHWHDAEVINHENGKPDFLFRGQIADLVDGASVHLSLSHDAGIASAMVVIER